MYGILRVPTGKVFITTTGILQYQQIGKYFCIEKYTDRNNVEYGVPQGSRPCLLLFLSIKYCKRCSFKRCHNNAFRKYAKILPKIYQKDLHKIFWQKIVKVLQLRAIKLKAPFLRGLAKIFDLRLKVSINFFIDHYPIIL